MECVTVTSFTFWRFRILPLYFALNRQYCAEASECKKGKPVSNFLRYRYSAYLCRHHALACDCALHQFGAASVAARTYTAWLAYRFIETVSVTLGWVLTIVISTSSLMALGGYMIPTSNMTINGHDAWNHLDLHGCHLVTRRLIIRTMISWPW